MNYSALVALYITTLVFASNEAATQELHLRTRAPSSWVVLSGPNAKGELEPKGRYGIIGSQLLLQDSLNQVEEYIEKRATASDPEGISTWIYDADEVPIIKATYALNRVIIEETVRDTAFSRIKSYKEGDEALNDYSGSDTFYLAKEEGQIVVYEKRVRIAKYTPIQVITIEEDGNVLKFYRGQGLNPGSGDLWSIKVTKRGVSTKMSPDGNLTEVPDARIEVRDENLKGLSDESFLVDTVLRYGSLTEFPTAQTVVKAKVDSTTGKVVKDQNDNIVTDGVVVEKTGRLTYRLGNYHVSLITE